MAKKTKRKIAHPKLPMQRQLNLQHEGKYFDLRAIFDRLNERHNVFPFFEIVPSGRAFYRAPPGLTSEGIRYFALRHKYL